MRIEFEKLEQRPGTHVVPVKMSREELEKIAEQMADYTVRINAKEDDLKSYSREVREEIKELEEQRTAVTNSYRYKREPKPVEGLWGFDFDDHGRVRCRTCFERGEKEKEGVVTIGFYETEEALTEAHGTDAEHPLVTLWERPLGTKWFVDPTTGEVFGPLNVIERDLQKELAPPTREIEPFAIAFDSIEAIPLLDASQVSAAEAKIREDEKKKGHDRSNDDTLTTCAECGLEVRLHDQTSADPCKAAMLNAANEELAAQERRTEEKYGADGTLDPETTYPCGKCNVPTFGRDLQPVTIDGEQLHVCFACEQNVVPDQPKPEKKKRSKKKGGDQATA